MTEKQHMAILEIFEDLYRANMRASLFELENCMMSIETLPKASGWKTIMAQETLRHEMEQSITTLEQRLAVLRTRFLALPELKAQRDEVDDAS